MPEGKPSSRGTVATVIATAAVTVAVGVTAAALGGYIVPAGDRGSPTAVTSGSASAANATERQPAAASSGAKVVLVPIAPDVPVANPAAAEPELVLATHEEEREGEEHHGRRGRGHHGEHEEEDEHDGD